MIDGMKVIQPRTSSHRFDLEFSRSRRFDVVGFGTNSVDHLCIVQKFPALQSKTEILQYSRLAGGQVATALTFLARMGLKTKYIGKVGGDEIGRFSLESFVTESIDISSVIVEEKAENQFAVIVVEKDSGERTILSQRKSGLDFQASELIRSDVCAGRILHLDGYDMEGSAAAAAWCQEEGIPVSIDLDKAFPNCEKLIEKIDFLIVSSNFPVEFTGIDDPARALRELRKCFSGFLAVTVGSGGALTWIDDQCVTFPGLKVDAVDTTGAGDIFHGGFLYGLLQNWPLEQIMRFANVAAGLSCGYLGARSGIRPLHEIQSRSDAIPFISSR